MIHNKITMNTKQYFLTLKKVPLASRISLFLVTPNRSNKILVSNYSPIYEFTMVSHQQKQTTALLSWRNQNHHIRASNQRGSVGLRLPRTPNIPIALPSNTLSEQPCTALNVSNLFCVCEFGFFLLICQKKLHCLKACKILGRSAINGNILFSLNMGSI